MRMRRCSPRYSALGYRRCLDHLLTFMIRSVKRHSKGKAGLIISEREAHDFAALRRVKRDPAESSTPRGF